MSKEEEEVAAPQSVSVPEDQKEGTADESNEIPVVESENGDTVLMKLEKKVKDLEEENISLKDQYLRKTADFENFRKRMFREKDEAIKYANSNLLTDIITVIDDFERAIRSGQDQKDFDSFFSGIELIERQFVSLLERNWGLKRFDSLGEIFDPEKHEAIATGEADVQETVVLEDYQKGYMLQDRVIRHSKVKVSVPTQKQENAEQTDSVAEDDKVEEHNG
ncbi:MAG: nucleotide exchange factor GrpE [Spirochaetales bacterium]|nr:MAG: nucleotide exchange factor GrpE [Spirochaetales bacterium]